MWQRGLSNDSRLCEQPTNWLIEQLINRGRGGTEPSSGSSCVGSVESKLLGGSGAEGDRM